MNTESGKGGQNIFWQTTLLPEAEFMQGLFMRIGGLCAGGFRR